MVPIVFFFSILTSLTVTSLSKNSKHQSPPNQQDTPNILCDSHPCLCCSACVTMILGKPSHAKTSVRPYTGSRDCLECSGVPRMSPM